MRRQVEGVGVRRDHGERKCHVSVVSPLERESTGPSARLWRRSLAPTCAKRQHAKGTRLRAVPPTGKREGACTTIRRQDCRRLLRSTSINAPRPERRGMARPWSAADERSAKDWVCPFLRAIDEDDRLGSPVEAPHPANRCVAMRDPVPQSLRQQELVCLTSGHVNCPRYLRGVADDRRAGHARRRRPDRDAGDVRRDRAVPGRLRGLDRVRRRQRRADPRRRGGAEPVRRPGTSWAPSRPRRRPSGRRRSPRRPRASPSCPRRRRRPSPTPTATPSATPEPTPSPTPIPTPDRRSRPRSRRRAGTTC